MNKKIGILVVSDSRSLGTDSSGPRVVERLFELGFYQHERKICKDEVAEIKSSLLELCHSCAIIFTVGGTGFAPRDVTPEATLLLIERRADSLSELIRAKGLEKTPYSHLSRGIAGIRGQTLIVNLPGSPDGAADGVAAIGHLLPAIQSALAGDACPVKPLSD
jgi:molybdenum cofactor synthesis domain-containing protein